MIMDYLKHNAYPNLIDEVLEALADHDRVPDLNHPEGISVVDHAHVQDGGAVELVKNNYRQLKIIYLQDIIQVENMVGQFDLVFYTYILNFITELFSVM